jgi:hypothetical protein
MRWCDWLAVLGLHRFSIAHAFVPLHSLTACLRTLSQLRGYAGHSALPIKIERNLAKFIKACLCSNSIIDPCDAEGCVWITT